MERGLGCQAAAWRCGSKLPGRLFPGQAVLSIAKGDRQGPAAPPASLLRTPEIALDGPL